MSRPRTVADVLSQQVTLKLESIDRMSLNVYQPRLQSDRGLVNFFRFHRGYTFASSALMEPISNAFIANVERFVKQRRVPLITFRKGERQEDLVLPYRQQAQGRERVLVVGKAQEKTPACDSQTINTAHREATQSRNRCGLSLDREDRGDACGPVATALVARFDL